MKISRPESLIVCKQIDVLRLAYIRCHITVRIDQRFLFYFALHGISCRQYSQYHQKACTSSTPFVNIPNYPDIEVIKKDLAQLPNVIMLDIEEKAKDAGVPRSANVILLGAAQKALGIEYEKLEDAIRRVFGRKGEAIVEANIKALAIGKEAQK
jgi:Pyruvate/2-oxoacid:ferredoxin oxidoreductase gamma subunit